MLHRFSLYRFSAVLCLAMSAGSLMAHSELPSGHWCDGGQPREVASFRFEPEALVDTTRPPTAPGGTCRESIGAETDTAKGRDTKGGDAKSAIAKNCGQFDDDYQRGFDASNGYCGTFVRPRRLGEVADAGTVVTLVTEPAAFLSRTHHRDYTIAQGLGGVCVRCESVPISPLPSNRNSNH